MTFLNVSINPIMQVEIKAQEDENFRFTTTDETDDLKDDSHVSSVNNDDDDVLVGRDWYPLFGEYLTTEEYQEEINKIDSEMERMKRESIERLKAEQIAQQPVQPEPFKRREATLNNPSGHEWFNGTSWGVK